MDFMKNYGIILVIIMWFGYKWLNSRRIKAMLPELKKRGAIYIDVRSQEEYNSGNALCTVNFPLQELTKRISEIPKSTPIVLCCASGTRSGIAKMTLKKAGFKEVYNIGTWTNF